MSINHKNKINSLQLKFQYKNKWIIFGYMEKKYMFRLRIVVNRKTITDDEFDKMESTKMCQFESLK